MSEMIGKISEIRHDIINLMTILNLKNVSSEELASCLVMLEKLQERVGVLEEIERKGVDLNEF